MSLKNTSDSYGTLTIILHWLMAIMIIALVIVGFIMTSMDDGNDKWSIYATHKAVGLIVLVLALFRWYWVKSNKKLNPLASLSNAEITIANTTKWILMIMMLVIPVSGVIMSLAGGHNIGFFGLFTIEGLAEKNKAVGGIAHEIHEIGGIAIAVVIALHVLAAFKHHFLKKDNTLGRMLGRK
ncbi:MAG: cytochrome b [Gammaproteobacteria bacterium]|nr:cytochrome b [Gammaproteobacteria bacterium]